MYSVKEMFYSLQGEGLHTGRAAVFCRFTGCNLWSGLERHRKTAVCTFCDTDFLGTDGQNGGQFDATDALAKAIQALWPAAEQSLVASSDKPSQSESLPSLQPSSKYVIFTGGEPLLQLDQALIDAMQAAGFEVGIETNGTQPVPQGIDWVCLSPKHISDLKVSRCDELKLVYPQPQVPPEAFDHIEARVRYLSPMVDPKQSVLTELHRDPHTQAALQYCLKHPQWRLNLQSHKILSIS